MLDDFKLSRKNISGFYIAGIFSFFLFQLVGSIVVNWSSWIYSSMITGLGINVDQSSANSIFWLCFFLTCFIITLLIKKFITDPLGFYIHEEGAPIWQHAILIIIVLGAYIYLLNQAFSQPMPTKWMPAEVIKLLDGAKHTYSTNYNSVEEANTWAIVPWIWNLGPLILMYLFTFKMSKSE